MEKVKSKEMGVNECSRMYNIPSRTLRRHIQTGMCKIPLGRSPTLNVEHEKLIVEHIKKKLEKVGFAPDRKDIREMAYQFAEKLNIKHPFSETSMSAGNVWLTRFLKRNKELSIQKSEGLSLSRAHGMNRNNIQNVCNILLKIYDYFSKYVEIAYLSSMTSEATINALKSSFARYGIPKVVHSDGGTQYTSKKFKDFAKEWDFKHVISSARYPQSNGMSERHIQTEKRMMKKAKI